MNKWDSKRIAFISILIAMSISFVIIGTRFAALSSFPSFKLSLAGLPIKIIGFIFGPVVGFIIGFTTDVISFVFMPSFYFPLYSVALGISGMLPGISAMAFNYFYKFFSKENVLRRMNAKRVFALHKLRLELVNQNTTKVNTAEKKYQAINEKIDKISAWQKEKYQLNFGLISSTTILTSVLFALIITFIFIPQEIINNSFDDKGILKLLTNKSIFITIVSLGIVTCLIALLIGRFKMKSENYLKFVPIVVFVVFTEYLNIPTIAYADYCALKIDFIASMIGSLATSILKIWFNLVIIYFAIKIVMPLITKKTFNGYE